MSTSADPVEKPSIAAQAATDATPPKPKESSSGGKPWPGGSVNLLQFSASSVLNNAGAMAGENKPKSMNLLQVNAAKEKTPPRTPPPKQSNEAGKPKSSPTQRTLRPGGGTLTDLRPDASKGGAWNANSPGPNNNQRTPPRRRRGNRSKKARQKGKNADVPSMNKQLTRKASLGKQTPRKTGYSRPSAVSAPKSTHNEPEEHGAEHKTYPLDIMLLYRKHPDCAQFAETLPSSILRANLSSKQRGRTYPFFSPAKFQAEKQAQRAEEKKQKELQIVETKEPKIGEVDDDDRALDWVDAEVPEGDFDFSMACMDRDLPPGLARPTPPRASRVAMMHPTPSAKAEKSPPPGHFGPLQSGQRIKLQDPIARMTKNIDTTKLPPMPAQAKRAYPGQELPLMPTGSLDSSIIEAQARKAQNEVLKEQQAKGEAQTPYAGDNTEIFLDGDAEVDLEAKDNSYDAERDAERVQQERMQEEQQKLENLLATNEALPENQPSMKAPDRKRSPPPLNMDEMFGRVGRNMWDEVDRHATSKDAVKDGILEPERASQFDLEKEARERMDQMRARWGDEYLKQYVKMKYGQMMQNGYSQNQYARMQRKMMESMYTNLNNGPGAAGTPGMMQGPNVEQLRAYYMRYQAFMRKLATKDPARLQKLQTYVMQKYGRMSADKRQGYQQWYNTQKQALLQHAMAKQRAQMGGREGAYPQENGSDPRRDPYYSPPRTDPRPHHGQQEEYNNDVRELMAREAMAANHQIPLRRREMEAQRQYMLQQQQKRMAYPEHYNNSMSPQQQRNQYNEREMGHAQRTGDPRMSMPASENPQYSRSGGGHTNGRRAEASRYHGQNPGQAGFDPRDPRYAQQHQQQAYAQNYMQGRGAYDNVMGSGSYGSGARSHAQYAGPAETGQYSPQQNYNRGF